jgi:uncharacterized protein
VPPPPTRRVNDYAGALSAADRERLERQLAARERADGNQVVVAVFRSLEGENLEDFSIRLAERWRIGRKGLDNGVIFLIFTAERRMRLEVGYGLEPTLTDALAAAILREEVAPHFRAGRLADGLAAGLAAIDRVIAGTYRPPPPRSGARGLPWFVVAFVAGFAVGVGWLMFRVWARTWRGLTASHSGWIHPGSRRWRRARGRDDGPWIVDFPGGGGGWSGGGDVSGGGGSFGGGGGSFGGGGASGEW